MNTTRRTFLQTSSLLAASVPLAQLRLAGAERASATSGAAGVRRGLFFDADDLPRIRANTTDPRFAPFWQSLVTADLADDADFLANKVRFNNHVADMLRVRQMLERSAFVYAVNGDAKHLAIAKQAARKLLDYPKWDYFLEGGKQVMGLQRAPEATIAMCCALDWLGDALTPAERADIERGIAEKGAPACYTTLYGMKFPDRVKGWGFDPEDDYPQAFRVNLARWPLILNATNLKVIPTAALGIAACALHGKHPRAGQWLDLARSSAKAFATMFGADGAYDEGVSYWGYTVMHLAIFAEALWRTRGIDDRNLINYPGTVRYALAHAMPTVGSGLTPPSGPRNLAVPTLRADTRNDVVNFYDSLTNSDVSVAAWVARTHRDPLAQWFVREISEAKFPFALIWHEPGAKGTPPGPELHDVRLTNDLVISRTGWAAADSVVALRSGGPGNHEHADRNSVIFKAHGERLFHDPFRAGYSYTTERWKLRLTTAHTAVLLDGKGHQYHDGREGTNASWAWAHVTDFQTGPGWMRVTSDAAEAYELVNAAVERVERTLVFLKPDVLLVLDRVKLKSAAPVQLRFQVFNDDEGGSCSANGAAFEIVRPTASLRAKVAALGVAPAVKAGRLDIAEAEGVFPMVEATSASSTEHTLLTVCTAAPKGAPHGELAIARDGGGWRVTGTHGKVRVDVAITASGIGLPVVAIR
ncbi:MAG: heparinase II/III family protein [Verrucomicrobia bacterium]|nr:heparinase II/III family protein [Verrucomicrobiota bacterium]